MKFRDRWTTDEDGNQFVFTVEIQRALHKQGLPVEPDSLPAIKDERSANVSKSPERHSTKIAEKPQWEAPKTIQIDPETGKYVGRLKWFNESRGYGFIVRGGGEEIFFHKSNCIADPSLLNEGQWILYDVEEVDKGVEGTDVEPFTGQL